MDKTAKHHSPFGFEPGRLFSLKTEEEAEVIPGRIFSLITEQDKKNKKISEKERVWELLSPKWQTVDQIFDRDEFAVFKEPYQVYKAVKRLEKEGLAECKKPKGGKTMHQYRAVYDYE